MKKSEDAEQIKIVIADDHDLIREGVKNILKNHSEYNVVCEAIDGEDALRKVEEFRPGVLLMDISMPKISGLDILAQLKKTYPDLKIIIVSVHRTEAYLTKALRLGVNGYLNKENAAEELIPALRRVLSGGTYLGSRVSESLAEMLKEKDKQQGAATEQSMFTQRERDILRLVSEGKAAKEIGKVLSLSRRTVENYKNSLLKKLKLHNTAELIRYALENKLVDLG